MLNKVILYGSKNIHIFRQIVKIFRKLRIDYNNVKPSKPEVEFNPKAIPVIYDVRCYNCGGSNHKSKSINFNNTDRCSVYFR